MKNIKGRELGLIRFITAIEYRRYFSGRINFHCNRLIYTNCGIEHVAIHASERQLLILFKVVGNNNRTEVMYFDKCAEVHIGIGCTVLQEMLH